jgi:hypothetical protein
MQERRCTAEGDATWVALPTATPIEISILFFSGNRTAEACSAAFPTIGSRMGDTNATGSLNVFAADSIVSTTYLQAENACARARGREGGRECMCGWCGVGALV